LVEAEGLELKVTALHEVVPIGAPVRINFTLHNTSDRQRLVPGSLSMKSGHVSAKVITPSGTAHDFATIIRYTGDVMPQMLKPGQSIGHSVTLLWGANGPLFPTSGFYRIILKLDWYRDGVSIRISGTTSIMIMPPEDREHAQLALRIFSSPDALLALAIGGDHLEEGNKIIQAALRHDVLRPHYNLVEAKRVGQRFFNRKPRLKDTADMVDEDTVMSPTEVIRLAKILRYFADETEQETVDRMVAIIMKKAGEVDVQEEVKRMLKGIQYQV